MEKNFIRNSGYMKRKELDLAVKRLWQAIENHTWYGRACVFLVNKLSKFLNKLQQKNALTIKPGRPRDQKK